MFWSEHAHGDPCTIHDHHQVLRESLWISGFACQAQFQKFIEHFLFVSECGGMSWVVEVGEFCCGVRVGASHTLRAAGDFGDAVKDSLEFLDWGFMCVSDLVHPNPELCSGNVHGFGNEVVFAGEVFVKSHFGDARFGDDSVDADGSESVVVEEARGGFEYSLAWAKGRKVSVHAYIVKTDLSDLVA